MMKLFDARFAGFAHVFAGGVGVLVMGVYVKRHPAKGAKTWRINNGHIVGCADAHTAHIAAGTAAILPTRAADFVTDTYVDAVAIDRC